MSPFLGGLLIGLFIGANVGVVMAALLVSAKSGECGPRIERWLSDRTG